MFDISFNNSDDDDDDDGDDDMMMAMMMIMRIFTAAKLTMQLLTTLITYPRYRLLRCSNLLHNMQPILCICPCINIIITPAIQYHD